MPGNKTQLTAALKSMFNDLDKDATADEKAEQLAGIIDDYVGTVKVQTAIPVQVNTGSGTGATTSVANLQ